jgi:phospho-N-acetylmuramoyl-pentapeptide-transferase
VIYILGTLLEHNEALSFFRLVHYLSARSIGAALTATVLILVVTPVFIRYLHRRAVIDGAEGPVMPGVAAKAGTPTMGGALIVGVVAVSCLLWCDLDNRYLLVVLTAMLWFAGIGLVDDLAKTKSGSRDGGLSEPKKLAAQGLFAIGLLAFLLSPWSPLPQSEASTLYIPFAKRPLTDSMWIYLPFIGLFVLVVGNAVNITDGLDGLAIVPSVLAVGALGVFAYLLGNAIWSRYLHYPFLPGAGELAVLAAAVGGAGLGFLWFNAYPAQIFMGDTGSLAAGGCLATMCVLLKQEALFVILGGLFMAEALTSQVQDKIGIKWLGRRLLFRAPLHHNMQYKGLAEPKVVVRLWIVSFILALAALATLKLR